MLKPKEVEKTPRHYPMLARLIKRVVLLREPASSFPRHMQPELDSGVWGSPREVPNSTIIAILHLKK